MIMMIKDIYMSRVQKKMDPTKPMDVLQINSPCGFMCFIIIGFFFFFLQGDINQCGFVHLAAAMTTAPTVFPI